MLSRDNDRYRRGNRQERVIPNLIWSAVIIVGVAAAVALLSLLGNW
jgi:hypothetical protein